MISRVIVFAMLAGIAPALSGCANFDPDSLDIFHLNEKKKLPGERKELFPGGVPGVTQGIPPEYQKGNQPPPETAQALQAPASDQSGKAAQEAEAEKSAAVEPEAEPKPKPKPKRAAKPRTASQQPAQASSQPQQQMAPWPAPTQAAPAPWPSSPQPGTFSR
jgi:hypothetical protein